MTRAFARIGAWTVLLVGALAACTTMPTDIAGAQFVVVRHAEKADDGSKDPPLNAAGSARAQALAVDLRDAPLRAAYATAYRRTQATAAPTANTHSLQVTTYDANLQAAEFADLLRRTHADGTVLVVGHSNTIPGIAAALCQCSVPPMGDDEFDRRITIRIDAQGHAALQAGRY